MEKAEDLRSKGIEEIACISVNDAFVMAAWGKEHGADGKVVVSHSSENDNINHTH